MSTFPTPILIFKRYAAPNKDGTFGARLELRRDYGYKVDKFLMSKTTRTSQLRRKPSSTALLWLRPPGSPGFRARRIKWNDPLPFRAATAQFVSS